MRLELWPQGAPLALGNDAEDRPAITAYLLDNVPVGSAVPAIVVLPGGGYTHRAAHEGEPIARWANSRMKSWSA